MSSAPSTKKLTDVPTKHAIDPKAICYATIQNPNIISLDLFSSWLVTTYLNLISAAISRNILTGSSIPSLPNLCQRFYLCPSIPSLILLSRSWVSLSSMSLVTFPSLSCDSVSPLLWFSLFKFVLPPSIQCSEALVSFPCAYSWSLVHPALHCFHPSLSCRPFAPSSPFLYRARPSHLPSLSPKDFFLTYFEPWSALSPSFISVPSSELDYLSFSRPSHFIQNNKTTPRIQGMAWSEDCLHCADLQAELEKIRAHQKILDSKIDSHARMTSEKYEADLNLFLHRVSSLQEQFSELANRCSHAQDSIDILKYMLEKRNAPNTSSSSFKNAEVNNKPDESIAC